MATGVQLREVSEENQDVDSIIYSYLETRKSSRRGSFTLSNPSRERKRMLKKRSRRKPYKLKTVTKKKILKEKSLSEKLTNRLQMLELAACLSKLLIVKKLKSWKMIPTKYRLQMTPKTKLTKI